VGVAGTTATDLGHRLGISKQAAGKIVDRLVALGYVERVDDPADARRKLVRLTPRGLDGLRRSALIFDELRDRWAAVLGPGRLAALEDDLSAVTPADRFRLDVPGWFGG
jgi:DNA-binding MarR family transcriptional regulator